MTHRERFAPSPTGRLHLGHAFSALTAWDAARAAGGACLLRIEDIDRGRWRAAFEAGIFEDLAWLGLSWPEPVMRQSARMEAYADALSRLAGRGLTYRCTCTRKDIEAATGAPQEGVPPPQIYPGTCRGGGADPARPAAIRLDMARALEAVGALGYLEIGECEGEDGGEGAREVDKRALLETCGDIVIARKDVPASYHLAVVIDDAAQGVTHVTRGADLAAATPIHRLLQTLLDLPGPVYRHHRLIRDGAGRRLAKRADDLSLAALRAVGWRPADIRRAVGL